MSDYLVSDIGALRAALADPAGPAAIALAAGEIALSGEIVLRRAVRLVAAEGGTVLRLRGAEAGITVAAAGCELHGLVLSGGLGRGRAALELRDAAHCHLELVRVEDSEGVAIRATRCPGLTLRGVAVRGAGLEGLALHACAGATGDLALADIGLHGRAAGLAMMAATGFALRVEAARVAGSAVTLRGGGAADGCLAIRAEACQRALSVLGQAEAPLTGLSASVDGAALGECGVLLVNAERVALPRLAVTGGAPALRMDGRHGARGCVAMLHGAAEGAVEMRGGSRDNRVLHAAPETTPPPRPPATPAPRDICRVCGWSGAFRPSTAPWRESFHCGACRASLRYRAQAAALLEVLGASGQQSLRALAEAGGLARLAIYEPGVTGPLRPFLRQAGRYAQSRYGEAATAAQQEIEVQDLMACTHADASFDLVVTSDIFEHVRRPMAAFAEIRRILRPGGHHVFSIPTPEPLPAHSVARVDTRGAQDVHLLPPVYHGSGDGGRSLVYTDFGADLLDRLGALGLATRVLRYQPPGLPRPALTFVSRRA